MTTKKLTYSLTAAAASLALIAGIAIGKEPKPDAAAPAATKVTAAEIIARDITVSDEFTGRLEAVNTVQIRPRVSGYIQQVGFNEGELVKKGQLLFQIDPRPFQSEVDRLKATYAQARAQAALARSNSERAQRLLEQNAIANEEADRLATASLSAEAELGAIAAQLDMARLNLSYTQVTAPIDGRASSQRITLGNLVTSADVLTAVVSVNPVYANFDVDEQTFLKYSQGASLAGKTSPVRLGLANEEGFPHEARLNFVDNQVSTTSGTIRLRAVLDNADGRYTPGLFARLQLSSATTQHATLVDDRSVGTDLGNKFVYVIGDGNKVEYRRITVGPMVDGLRVVNAGLTPGDVVVVNGLQRVHPGEVVEAEKVAMDQRVDTQRKLAEAAGRPADTEANVGKTLGENAVVATVAKQG